MVSDSVAEQLESAGFWRRAAARWLEVMFWCDKDVEREWVSLRRRFCYSKIAVEMPSDKLGVTHISRAATRAQERMGISLPDGAAFRQNKRKMQP
ncbi:PerC family transcriptional regulator [Enterobacter asburiae]|uniref:PerC family transcriptional regulator n=1 Tax=Enterobacter asburiae TaxID=61645 RepID=UPI000F883F3B|nr:PerC family transcriptional regulator [Lelliottia aquatilis]RTP87906.1 PerC family transcriptional regulator [Enterobacter asburiae]